MGYQQRHYDDLLVKFHQDNVGIPTERLAKGTIGRMEQKNYRQA
jgi:hypothetical protein